MDGTLKENESVSVTGFLHLYCYRALPQAHSSKRWYQVYDDDGDLHLRHVNPAKTPYVRGGAEQVNLKTQTKAVLTGQSALSRTRRSATGRRRTWTSPQNHRRTSSSGTGLFHRKYTFPRQQRLKAEERDRWLESHSCSNQKLQMITVVSEHLWRRHRSHGRRSPPGQRSCSFAWTASHRWHQETGRRRGRMRSTQRPTMEPRCEEVKKTDIEANRVTDVRFQDGGLKISLSNWTGSMFGRCEGMFWMKQWHLQM